MPHPAFWQYPAQSNASVTVRYNPQTCSQCCLTSLCLQGSGRTVRDFQVIANSYQFANTIVFPIVTQYTWIFEGSDVPLVSTADQTNLAYTSFLCHFYQTSFLQYFGWCSIEWPHITNGKETLTKTHGYSWNIGMLRHTESQAYEGQIKEEISFVFMATPINIC